MNNIDLLQKARETMKHAYSKYSNFQVGAALLTKDGRVYTGCNIENSSYGAAICAERVAFVKAISEGARDFQALALTSSNGKDVYPCGICRQFMSEFGLDLKIIVEDNDTYKEHVLKDLLPAAFTSF